MDTKQRRRRIGLFAGALIVATLTTVWLCHPEPTLIDISHAVGTVDEEKQDWKWLSDVELLVVATDKEPDNLLGAENEETHWQGHVEICNVVTGKRKQMAGLTNLLNRKGVSPTGRPELCAFSPDLTWLAWYNQKTLDHWPFPAAAHLDGTHYREWNCDRVSGSFLDDQHWIEQSDENGRNPPVTHIVDLEDNNKDRSYPSSAPQVAALVAEYAQRHPQFVSVEFSANQRSVEIATYHTADASSLVLAQEGEPRPHALTVQNSSIKLPHGTYMIDSNVSPDQHTILYHLHTHSINPVLGLLHRILPNVSEERLETESLWVSETDGQGFHEIGHVVVPFVPQDIARDAEKSVLSRIEWLPGGKQVAFVYRSTLFVAPAK